ncbi:MAG: Dihydrodipicolinate synthase family protein bll7272, partial [uncultured Thermomicrobiales bacterium]
DDPQGRFPRHLPLSGLADRRGDRRGARGGVARAGRAPDRAGDPRVQPARQHRGDRLPHRRAAGRPGARDPRCRRRAGAGRARRLGPLDRRRAATGRGAGRVGGGRPDRDVADAVPGVARGDRALLPHDRRGGAGPRRPLHQSGTRRGRRDAGDRRGAEPSAEYPLRQGCLRAHRADPRDPQSRGRPRQGLQCVGAHPDGRLPTRWRRLDGRPGLRHPAPERRALRPRARGALGRGIRAAAPALAAERAVREVFPRGVHQGRARTARLRGRRAARAAGAARASGGGGDSCGAGGVGRGRVRGSCWV